MSSNINWPTFRGRYAHLSYGKDYAKHIPTGKWARRADDSHDLILDMPGKWFVGSSDGFSRKEARYWVVAEDGSYKQI